MGKYKITSVEIQAEYLATTEIVQSPPERALPNVLAEELRYEIANGLDEDTIQQMVENEQDFEATSKESLSSKVRGHVEAMLNEAAKNHKAFRLLPQKDFSAYVWNTVTQRHEIVGWVLTSDDDVWTVNVAPDDYPEQRYRAYVYVVAQVAFLEGETDPLAGGVK